METKLKSKAADWACALFIFDCAVMPVIKLFGLSLKISYAIALISIMFMFLEFLARKEIALGSATTVLTCLVLYIVLMFSGEIWCAWLYGISFGTRFLKTLIGIAFMIASLYYGYRCKACIGAAAYWSFVLNVIVNCTLALMGRTAPAFLTSLYNVSVETFTDGYYRNGGIIGNPNATLLVTNMVLLLVVILYRYDMVRLSNVKLASLYLLSIGADIIVSSRGELVHTVLILAYLTYCVIKKNKNMWRLFKRIFAVAVIITVVVALLWGAIVARFPNIQTSIDRMNSMESMLDSSADEQGLGTIARPFFKYDVFLSRYKHSPIWGTGIDGNGNTPDFVKGTTGYHNDFFMILGATGILGLILWIRIIGKAIRKIGICMLFPFMITAISNTFIQSYFGTMLYFFIIGYMLHFLDEKQRIGKDVKRADLR